MSRKCSRFCSSERGVIFIEELLAIAILFVGLLVFSKPVKLNLIQTFGQIEIAMLDGGTRSGNEGDEWQ